MATKPAQLCQMKKNKVLGAQENLCDTFNWMAQSLNNLKGGKNCTVDWDAPDKPTINVNLPDEGTGGNGSQGIMAVYDVVKISGSGSQSQDELEIQYVDDREASHIPIGGGSGGDITIEGTDGTSYTGDSFQFASAGDSNVTVSVDGSGVMTIGVHYV